MNLAVEAKGRSSSLALNRVVCQTSVEIVGRELYPKACHTPTWSLRADAPSRSRNIERPRCRWPGWLWDFGQRLRDSRRPRDPDVGQAARNFAQGAQVDVVGFVVG